MTDVQAVRVREAERRDAVPIARVHVDAWRETYSDLLPQSFFDDEAYSARKEMWERSLAAPSGSWRICVAERDGDVIGFAATGPARGPDAEKGYPVARPLHLFSIYLLRAHHGSGAGQGLLDAVLRDEPAQLWVARANDRAIAFYERNGFAPDGAEFEDPELEHLVELRFVR